MNESDIDDYSNFTIIKNGVASVKYLSNISLIHVNQTGCFERLNLDHSSLLRIDPLTVYINSTLAPRLNARARLTYYGVGFVTPALQRDGVACSDCTLVLYNSGDAIFAITGF